MKQKSNYLDTDDVYAEIIRDLKAQNAELLEALKEVLETGFNGGNNVRLCMLAASQKELSHESLHRAELSESAVLKARAAIEKAERQ